MIRLRQPVHTYEQTIEACCNGIPGNNELLTKLQNDSSLLQEIAISYSQSASTGELYQIPPIDNSQDRDSIVTEQLTKSDLLRLYDNYFAKKTKPGRIIYDNLMAIADEKCPFCGGIGRPKNLDHYLPKTHYPQFSILPINLVPCCRDCNMDGKKDNFATCEEEQILQPYLDHDRYFNEQWISANYLTGINNEPGVIKYFVLPPQHWEETHKKRVQKHFNDFELGLRFSKEAAPRLITYLETITNLRNKYPSIELADAKNIILGAPIKNSPCVNHWERIMCLALLNEL